jgi:hypothetical protein
MSLQVPDCKIPSTGIVYYIMHGMHMRMNITIRKATVLSPPKHERLRVCVHGMHMRMNITIRKATVLSPPKHERLRVCVHAQHTKDLEAPSLLTSFGLSRATRGEIRYQDSSRQSYELGYRCQPR